MPHSVVTGAAGFIGSHLVDRLLCAGHTVSGIDNFSRGRREHLSCALGNPRFQLIEGDLSTEPGAITALEAAFKRDHVDTVWHLAANSDIAAGVANPALDLRDTFMTTFHTLGAMRRLGIETVAFASTSAVYGVHDRPLSEDTGPLFPISYYGAMKLASEAAISASVESFLSQAYIFRFPNVVGGRATHGILFDLINKLRHSTAELEVLGDGSQQKPYLHVSELIGAMLVITGRRGEALECFNISGHDDGCSVRQIADAVVRRVAPATPIRYTGTDRGWKGDVPRFRYCADKLSALGWEPKLSSSEAIGQAISELAAEEPTCSS